MGEMGTITIKTDDDNVGSVASQGDHSVDIKNALEELPYNVIPSVTVSKDAVNVAGTSVGGNKFKQQYSITFDNAANSGDQNMLTCNAEACDEDGCAPRTSGVTHNKFFTTANDLGSGGDITAVGKGSFKIKVSNVGGYMWRGAIATKVVDDTTTAVTFVAGAGVISNNDYVKIGSEWVQVTTYEDNAASTITRGEFGTGKDAHNVANGGDVWVQKTVPTSFGTWTVCRPFADGSKSCASFPGSSTAATVQTALRTITGWEGVTVSLENELLWVDQTYVVTYAAGYDDEGIIPTVDAYLIASDNTGSQITTITVDEYGVAETSLGSRPTGLD